MKKINFLFAILCSFSSIAQTPPTWSNSGNNASSSDYVGTNNNQPLIFKTNAVERSRILPTGEFQIGSGGLKINPGLYNASPIGAYMLEVGGSAYVDRSLFVREYINSLKGLRGPKIDVDSILMDSTRGIYGKTKIFGDVQIQQNLTVNGDATFNGKVTAAKGFMVDNTTGFSFTPGATPGSGTFQLGKIQPIAIPCAAPNNPGFNLQVGGNVQLYNSSITNSGLLNFQTFQDGCSIDGSVGGNTGNQGLLLNYFLW